VRQVQSMDDLVSSVTRVCDPKILQVLLLCSTRVQVPKCIRVLVQVNDARDLSYIAAELGLISWFMYAFSKLDDIYRHFAMMCASVHGFMDGIRFLESQEVDIYWGYDSPLHPVRWAARSGHLEVVQYLVSKGANVHACNNVALCEAAMNGHIQVVRYLVSQGANVRHGPKGSDQNTPLSMAATYGHLETVVYLLSQGANVTDLSSEDISQIAKQSNLETKRYLVSQGVSAHLL
jgi:hypothetical protein